MVERAQNEDSSNKVDQAKRNNGFQPSVFKININHDQRVSFFSAIESEYRFSSLKKNDNVLSQIK